MQDEITVKPLVDILSLQLGKQVVMSGTDYVLLDDNSAISQDVVDVALGEQTAEFLQRIEDAKPNSITKIQAMRAMKQTGTLWTDFNTLISSNVDAMDEWTLATALERNNPFVLQLAPTLGMTATSIDDLFLLGSTL